MSEVTSVSGQFSFILQEAFDGPAEAIEEAFTLINVGEPTTEY